MVLYKTAGFRVEAEMSVIVKSVVVEFPQRKEDLVEVTENRTPVGEKLFGLDGVGEAVENVREDFHFERCMEVFQVRFLEGEDLHVGIEFF